MRHDIRIALRLLLRDRGFTVLAALALGLGIGVNSTFFSLVNNSDSSSNLVEPQLTWSSSTRLNHHDRLA